MRHTLLLCGALSFAMAFVGAAIGVTLAAPAIADAQDARIRVERLVIVDDNGADRVLLRTVPGMSAGVGVFAPDGTTTRVSMNTGAGRTTVGTVAEAAGLELYLLDGTRVGRLGTHNPELGEC